MGRGMAATKTKQDNGDLENNGDMFLFSMDNAMDDEVSVAGSTMALCSRSL